MKTSIIFFYFFFIITSLTFGFYLTRQYLFGQSADGIVEKITNYPMNNIIARCKKDHGYSDDDMVILEKELKRYFIMIASKEPNSRPLPMYSADVDNLWHAFILFTKEYAHFCESTVGYFIHHNPLIATEQFREESLIIIDRTEYRDFLMRYERAFNEPIHPVWLIDAVEKITT